MVLFSSSGKRVVYIDYVCMLCYVFIALYSFFVVLMSGVAKLLMAFGV